MPTTAYNSGLLTLTDGSTDFAADGVYAVLVNGYTFSRTDTAYSSVSAAELSSAGDYAPQALASKTVALAAGNVLYDCANISFGATVSIGPADGIVFVKGSAASPQAADPLLFYRALADVQSTDAVFEVTTANGLYQITHDAV